jgi:1-phosphofructokinase family hexose kinase
MITCLGLSPALDITYRIDRLRTGEIHRPTRVLSLPGGKSLNVARALRVVGSPSVALTVLGGATGDAVARALEDDGVEVRLVRQAAETRRCVSVIEEPGGRATEFYEPAPDIDDQAWDDLTARVTGISGGFLALSGSLPTGVRLQQLTALLRERADAGVEIAVDTHGPALPLLLERVRLRLVKVNRAEAASVLGDADPAQLARALHERGAEIAIVTDGRDGCAAASAAGIWTASAPAAGSYAVGSGDCFLAGLLAALESAASVPDALVAATAAAAANTLEAGAAIFTLADAERLGAEVRVTRTVGV